MKKLTATDWQQRCPWIAVLLCLAILVGILSLTFLIQAVGLPLAG